MVAAVSATPNPKGRAEKKTVRPPLLPSDADNGVVPNRRPRPREVTSRYMSPTTSISTTNSGSATSTSSSSSSSSSRRYPSPLVSRTAPMTPMPDSSAAAAIRRSQSVDRRRPATPRPNTPGKSSGEVSAAAKLLVSSKRSLSVSFQGDSFSIPTRTATKPAPATISLSSARRGTPERGRLTPVRDQAENSKPIDKHRWPGRSREVNSTTRSLNCGGDKKRLGGSGNVVRTLQQSMIIDRSKASFDNSNAKLDKVVQLLNDVNSAAGSAAEFDPVASDAESVSSVNGGVVQDCGSVAQVRGGPRGIVVPARFLQETNNRMRRLPEPKSPVSRNNGLRTLAPPPIASPRGVSSSRGTASPIRGAVRPSSPSKPVTPSASSLSRGMLSPSRVKNGVAASTLNHNDLSRTPSILSFAVDVRRGKVGENRVVDAQLLRLLHNRHLQWRFINARADAATMVQKVTAEKSLYNAWVTTSKLWHSVKTKRVELQMLRRNLKLYSILKGQMVYMDDWDPIDQDHSSSLSGLTVALEASTVRLPVVSGARADIQNVKDAICSAVDVMQGMASSICSLVTKVDQVNSVASELANITAKERALLDQCNDLLSTLTAMQVKDCSLRSHRLQLRSVPSSLTTDL